MKKKYGFIAIALLAIGCGREEKMDTVEEIPIVVNSLNLEESLGRAYDLELVNNYLVLRDDQVDTKLTLFDLEAKNLFALYTGYRGQGPGELMNPGPIITEKNGFSVYDGSKMKLLSFQLDSIEREDYRPEEKMGIEEVGVIDVKKITDDKLLAVGVFPENRFLLIDQKGKTIAKFGDYPIDSDDNTPAHVLGIACQSMLTTNLERNMVATAMRYAEHIQFHQFNENESTLNLVKEHQVFLPEYTTNDQNGGVNFRPTEETRWGYLSVSSNADYVYALYSGKFQIPGTDFYQGNEVHVFDWKGNLVKKLILDKPSLSITCNETQLFTLYEAKDGYDIAEYTF